MPKAQRDWRTRSDPFEEVWSEISSMLAVDPLLQGKTIFEWLVEQYPGRFSEGQLRTLQRRLRHWRATEGPDKEVFFPQIILPARQSQSDFTWCNTLGITINGVHFKHMLFHFMLPYSRWETAFIAYSESFESLTDGYSRAVRELGAVAPEHRTDNLAAAVPIGERRKFQQRWKDFLAFYGVTPSANNPTLSHENGSIEKSHHLFKSALDQRLRLRGSRDFGSIDAYESFFRDLLKRRNKDRVRRLNEELKLLPEVPTRLWTDPKEVFATVSPWSTISILRSAYSVPSRLIGSKVRAAVYRDRIEVFFGSTMIQEMPRIRPGEASINYRHIIHHLVRKPAAFANYRYREELFPSASFRQAFDELGGLKNPKEYLRLLQLAALNNESDVESSIRLLLATGETPTAESVKGLLHREVEVPTIAIPAVDLKVYDQLLSVRSMEELRV